MYELFTPVSGLAGGTLIGLSAGTVLLYNGDIMGASGIMNNILTVPHETFRDQNRFWRSALLSSFLFTASFVLGPSYCHDERMLTDATVPIASAFAQTLSGFLVGFGARMGNGCTSGHGVCGLGRQSKRSFTAVMTFMTTSIITMTVTAPTSPFSEYTTILRADAPGPKNPALGATLTAAVICATLVGFRFAKSKLTTENIKKSVVGAIAGSLFAAGLGISKMVLGSKLFGFMDLNSFPDKWDPSLATVLGSAVGVSTLAYQFVKGHHLWDHPNLLEKPLVAEKFSIPTNTQINRRLVIGAAIFGMGWGIGLVCPAPALFQAAVGNTDVLFRWMPAYTIGAILANQF
eukprot:Nitzschia sp. Nitz4//scaffold19_size178191//81702//82825//NITZ4_001976-RA/size178191-processed-gene-0.17-mRNA-1//1//CDS//3329540676//2559//frame0